MFMVCHRNSFLFLDCIWKIYRLHVVFDDCLVLESIYYDLYTWLGTVRLKHFKPFLGWVRLVTNVVQLQSMISPRTTRVNICRIIIANFGWKAIKRSLCYRDIKNWVRCSSMPNILPRFSAYKSLFCETTNAAQYMVKTSLNVA